MIEQAGVLTRTAGNRAWVRLGGQSGCPACDAGQGCGAGIFARLLRRQAQDIELHNALGARAGETVLVGIAESVYLALVLRAYGLPLLLGLAGAWISHQIGGAVDLQGAWLDAVTLAGGLAAASLAWWWPFAGGSGALLQAPLQMLALAPRRNDCAGASADSTDNHLRVID